MLNKAQLQTVMKIVIRADNMGIMRSTRITAMMDVEFACEQYDLDLEKFIAFDDFNFAHDFIGIQSHIDREHRRIDLTFLPRCANWLKEEALNV